MRRPVRFLLALALVAALTGSAAIADEPTDPVESPFTEQQVYFHQADTKVGNLGALGYGTLPSWNTTAPASVTTGSGGGYLGNIASEIALGDHTAESGPTFEGAFTGPIDTLAVDLYAFANPADAKQGLRVQVLVDGEMVHEDGDAFDVPLKAGGQAAKQLNFAITGIDAVMKSYGMDTSAEREHTVRINIVPFYVGDDAVYVYDAAEAPSGIIFNATAEKLGSYVVVPANG
jgi:hypothetical protein